jgi:hypothetical protein
VVGGAQREPADFTTLCRFIVTLGLQGCRSLRTNIHVNSKQLSAPRARSRFAAASTALALFLTSVSGEALLAQSPIFDPVLPGSGNWTTVANGNFEALSGSLLVSDQFITPGSWYLFTSAGRSGTATAEASAARSGQRGIRIQPGNNSGAGIALTLGSVFFLPSTPHVLSGWVRRSDTTSANADIYLDLWGAAGGFRVDTAPQPGWQFVYGVFTPTGGQIGIRAVMDQTVASSEVVLVDELAITPLASFAPPVQAVPAINVRFALKDSPPIAGPAAFGNLPTDFWNLYAADATPGVLRTLGSLAPLTNTMGEATGAGLVISNAPGAWATGATHPLMATYLYPLEGEPKIAVTVTNLPTGSYDLYLYGHGGPADDFNTEFGVRSGPLAYGPRRTGTNDLWRGSTWVEGAQYVRFNDVYVSSGSPLMIEAGRAARSIPSLNGLQLVQRNADIFRVWPESTTYTNSLRLVMMKDPGVQVRVAIGTNPTPSSVMMPQTLDLTTTVTLQIQAFNGDIPVSPVLTRIYRRFSVFDTDIPAAWRIRYFGEDFLYNPDAPSNADPDGDGSTNLEEYRASTNPLDPLDGFNSGARLVPAVQWTSVPGVTYRILRKDRLSDLQWTEVSRITANGSRSEYVDTAVSDLPRFYLVQPVR